MSKNKKYAIKKVRWQKLFGLKKVHSTIYDKSYLITSINLNNNDLSTTMKEIIKKEIR